MSGSKGEWIFVVLFFACFFAATLGELYWLNRKRGIAIRRAMVFVFSTNFITITIGFFVSFVIFAVMLAIAWDEHTPMPAGEAGYVTALVMMVLFPFALMVVLRLLLINLLKLGRDAGTIVSPLKYSLALTTIFFALVVAIPITYLFLS